MSEVIPNTGPAPSPTQGAGQNINALTQQLVQRVLQNKSQLPQQPGTPAPMHKPEDQQVIPGHGKHKEQFEMGQQMGNSIMKGVMQGVQDHKQKQINLATNDWQQLMAAHERLEMLGKVGQNGEINLMDDPLAKVILADPKKMKNMSKAFQVDWLNPEKTTPYRQGLEKAMKLDKSGRMIKTLKSLIGKKPDAGGQMTDEQKGQMGQHLGQNVEGMQVPNQVDPKVAADVAKATADKYDYKVTYDKDGQARLYAVDKTNPNAPAIEAKTYDPDTGKHESLRAVDPKGLNRGQLGKIMSVDSVPTAVMTEKGWVTPRDPEFSKDPMAQRHYADAQDAWFKGEQAKTKLANIRAQTYINSREYALIVGQDIPELGLTAGQMTMLNPGQIGKYYNKLEPVAGSMQAMTKKNVFDDINYNIDNVDKAIGGLKKDLSPSQRAQLIMAMRSVDPSAAIGNFIQTQVAPDDQPMIDYLTSMVALQENAMALRSVQGAGGASDMLREKIEHMVPGGGTKTPVARAQLKIFRGIVQRLGQGIPETRPGKMGPGEVISDPSKVPD